MKDKYIVLLSVFIINLYSCTANPNNNSVSESDSSQIIVGAERLEDYIHLINDKKIAVIANQTSMIYNTHLVDTLLALNIDIRIVFAPEHGFRGNADAGAFVKNDFDEKTGLPIVSLYGKNKKPTSEHLSDIDCIIFDIQDVGTRFYTYISTLQYVMEAAADLKIPVLVLDRPNPNGFFVDGPVLDTNLRSFVGMNPIPIIHGLTVGEYAMMLIGENWLKTTGNSALTVIPVKNYEHSTLYQLPQKPSPNLPNMNAIYLYPSLCLFEGTVISVGRGTNKPFQHIGHPSYIHYTYSFTPVSMMGSAKNPKHKNTKCYGLDLSTEAGKNKRNPNTIELEWLIKFYNDNPDKNSFFNSFFDKLSGTHKLRNQIISGQSSDEIKSSWQKEIANYKIIRKKYLLYPDFE